MGSSKAKAPAFLPGLSVFGWPQGLLEAILHYNIGKYTEEDGIKLYLPTFKEMVAIIAVLVIFAAANSWCADYLSKK